MAVAYTPTAVYRNGLVLPSPGDAVTAASVNTPAFKYLADSAAYSYLNRALLRVPPRGYNYDQSQPIYPATAIDPAGNLAFNVVIVPPGSLSVGQTYTISDSGARDGDWLYLGNNDGQFDLTLLGPDGSYVTQLRGAYGDSLMLVRHTDPATSVVSWLPTNRNISSDGIRRADAQFENVQASVQIQAPLANITEMYGTLLGTMAGPFAHLSLRDVTSSITARNRIVIGSSLPGPADPIWSLDGTVSVGDWMFFYLGNISQRVFVWRDYPSGPTIVELNPATKNWAFTTYSLEYGWTVLAAGLV